MEYTKTADAIISELENWFAQAKDLAVQVRKTERQGSAPFWNGVTEQTGTLLNNVRAVLNRANSTAHAPDKITDGMGIAKLIDDTTFELHIISIQIAMMEAKMPKQAGDIAFSEKYGELVWAGATKAKKTMEFFRELLLLVVEDMWETAAKKIHDATVKGKNAAASIPENLGYIKDEIMQLVDNLSATPTESMTLLQLEDCFLKAKLITITAKLNIDTAYSAIFENMRIFTDALDDAASFCRTIITPKEELSLERKKIELMQDIAFMGNIILFLAKGEMEALYAGFSESEIQANKLAFDDIKAKINDYIKVGLKAEREVSDISMFQEIADKTYELVSDLDCEANKLGVQGGALKVIADEHKRLADKLVKCLEGNEDLVRAL